MRSIVPPWSENKVDPVTNDTDGESEDEQSDVQLANVGELKHSLGSELPLLLKHPLGS